MRRRFAMMAAAACLAFGLTRAQAAPPVYSVTNLDALSGGVTFTQLTGFNNLGQICGTVDITGQPPYVGAHGYRWDPVTPNGTQYNAPVDIAGSPILDEYDLSALGINDLGQVMGMETGSPFVTAPNAYVASGGTAYGPGPEPGIVSYFAGVNAAGQIAETIYYDPGYLDNSPGIYNSYLLAFNGSGQIALSPLPGDTDVFTYGLNSAGLVAGLSASENLGVDGDGFTVVDSYNSHPVVWSASGVPQALPLPAGYDNGVALQINANGLIIGAAYTLPATPVNQSTALPTTWVCSI